MISSFQKFRTFVIVHVILLLFIFHYCAYSQRSGNDDFLEETESTSIINELSDDEEKKFNYLMNTYGEDINLFRSRYFINFLVPLLFPFIMYFLYFNKEIKNIKILKYLNEFYLILILFYIPYIIYLLTYYDERIYLYKSLFNSGFYIRKLDYDIWHAIDIIEDSSVKNKYLNIGYYLFDIPILIYLIAVTLFMFSKTEKTLNSQYSKLGLWYFFKIKNIKSEFYRFLYKK